MYQKINNKTMVLQNHQKLIEQSRKTQSSAAISNNKYGSEHSAAARGSRKNSALKNSQ
jgi:hypothetical protein